MGPMNSDTRGHWALKPGFGGNALESLFYKEFLNLILPHKQTENEWIWYYSGVLCGR